MKKQWLKSLALIGLILSSSAGAWAQDGLYAGVGMGQFTHTADQFGFSDSGTSTGYSIQLGAHFNEYIALEHVLSAPEKRTYGVLAQHLIPPLFHCLSKVSRR